MTRSIQVLAAVTACVVLLAAAGVVLWRHGAGPGPVAHPRLDSVGPRLTSNQTAQPLAIHGEGLAPGLRLVLGPPLSLELPLTVVDARHAYTRLPAGVGISAGEVQAVVTVRLAGPPGMVPEGEARLTVVNDAAFPDLTAMVLSPDGRTLFIASPPTDTVFSLDVASGRVEPLTAGDGPSALATYVDAGGHPWLAVAHRWAGALHLYALDAPGSAPRVLPAPAGALGLTVDGPRGVAFVAEHVRDSVHALSLEDGHTVWTAKVDPNPRELARWKGQLAVGSLQTGQVELLRQEDGAPGATLVPRPGVPIIGGGTERYSAQVMGGTAARGLVASEKLGRLFLSSVGPNVGPNAERMEVSPNGGVAELDPERGEVLRHRGFGAGITEGLVLDDEAGLLYAADVGLGRVRVLDARQLKVLQEVAMPLPEDTPLVRPAADFGTAGRAGVELHAGPRSLALAPDGHTLYVLNRHTGMVAVVDVSEARAGRAKVTRQWPVTEMRTQAKRRLGQVLYYADLGRTAMSCDACHPEGHTGGVFFAKTRPMRIYRSPTALGSRDTPPYFTPASTFSLAETMRTVGNRNRFHNPDLTDAEVEALSLYVSLMSTPPNPFRDEHGAPQETVELPDGRRGSPARGRAFFEGKGTCTGCHPAPLFTLDQEPTTRGRFLQVGTPGALPLRLDQQTLVPGFGTPALVGSWDVWPMLGSGAAGFEVRDGNRLGVGTRFPLRAVLELSGPEHGDMKALTPGEQDDLLAWLVSL